MAIALPWHGRGCRFESDRVHKKVRDSTWRGCPLCGIGFKKGENGVCAGIDGFYFLTILSAGLGRDWANRRISGFWSSCCFPPGKTERLSLTRAI